MVSAKDGQGKLPEEPNQTADIGPPHVPLRCSRHRDFAFPPARLVRLFADLRAKPTCRQQRVPAGVENVRNLAAARPFPVYFISQRLALF